MGSAVFSECGRYRYRLTRDLDGALFTTTRTGIKTCCFVMLNPSTADADANDPTIRRCIGFAGRWGFHKLIVVNLFALRSTDPERLKCDHEPIGSQNDRAIIEAVDGSDRVICAWGNHGGYLDRDRRVLDLLAGRSRPKVLRLSKCGRFPAHPLYLPNATEPKAWDGFWLHQESRMRAMEGHD